MKNILQNGKFVCENKLLQKIATSKYLMTPTFNSNLIQIFDDTHI